MRHKLQAISIALIWLVVTLPFVVAQDNQTNATNTTTNTPVIPISISNVALVFENDRTLATWETNIPTTSAVDYGRSVALGNSSSDAGLVTNHSVSLQTQSGTQYYFRITSCDPQGTCKAAPTQNFFAGKLFVNADIPRYSRTKLIDITGRTRPGATVSLSLNGAEVRKAVTQKTDFLFRDVQLAAGTSNLTLSSILGAENASFSTLTEIDSEPAAMNVSMPATATAQPVSANVTVSEAVNLTVTVKPQGQAPLRTGNLQTTKAEATSVSITWNEVNDASEYGVYRDDKLLATATAGQYTDSAVSPGKTYQYQVSAVTKNCVEGDKSDLLTVPTPNGTARPDTFTPTKFSCAQDPVELFLKPGKSTVSVPTHEGESLIEFKAVDKAGYVTIVEERVVYDTGPPRFVETNLRQLSPTYSPDVTAKGKLSEKGSVTAIVNGKPQKTVVTADDGTFSIPLKLERSANLQANATAVVGQIVWSNTVKLAASDAVGLTAETGQEQIDFQLCGTGTKVSVDLSKPSPDMLSPRLLMQGVQTIGLSFKYKYNGGQTATIDKNQVKVIPVVLSPDVEKQFDNKFVRYTAKPLGIRSTAQGKKNEGTGYIQFTFNGIDNPWDQLPELKDAKAPSNATTQAKLEAIGKHRSKDCLIPGFGCMKLFFELEIPLQETVGPLSPDQTVRGGTIENTKTEVQFQRTCLPVEIPIDIPIPPRYIPKGLLQTTAQLLTAIIEGIDKILKPIQTIGQYLLYTCLAGQAITLVPIFMEKYRCEFSGAVSAISSEGKFSPDVAAIGACEDEYSAQGQDQSKQNCNDCAYWKRKRPALENVYRQVCDRVMCPTAPSLQFFLKQNAAQTLKPVPLSPDGLKNYADATVYPRQDGQVTVGSDCAAWVKANSAARAATSTRQPPRLFFSYEQVKGIYQQWLDHQGDTSKGALLEGASSKSGKVNCDDLHPASPECCGFAYMKEWSSACGVSGVSFLDTFDEIKESTCLSAEKSGQSSINLPAAGTTPAVSTECGNVLNSVGGFCDPQGGPPPEPIPIIKMCCDSPNGPTGRLLAASAAKEQKLFLFLLPRNAQTVAPQGATTGEYDIGLGEVVESVEFDRTPHTPPVSATDQIPINANLKAIRRTNTVISQLFDSTHIDKYNKNPDDLRADYDKLHDELCHEAGYLTPVDMTKCAIDGREIYTTVMGIIGTPDKEYIIKPADGLVNSLRCICLPTLVAFLKRWRNILGAVRDCMNTILLTGDGSSGICQAVVSQQACDLLYDAIACFTQKFSTPSGGSRGKQGIGDVMGALTATGTEMSRSVQSRYGETSVYKQLFVDRKLIHSICLFAFTGTWNFDVNAVFDAAVNEVPTKTMGLVFPCSRRFVGFNPATRPGGLVSWQYQFGAGMAAGSQVDGVELVLKCSGGYKCRESDGFIRGKCDCETPKEIVINPEGMFSNAKNGEIVNKQLFATIDGTPGDGQIRYDKAYLRWNWNDGKKTQQDKTDECTISQEGGSGAVPGDCRFDPLSLAFRCTIGDQGDGIQFVDVTVRAPQSIPQPTFALNDAIDADLKVRQFLVDSTSLKGTKFIQYRITNNQGREVAKNDFLVPEAKNGDYTLNTKDNFGSAPKVSPAWFGSGGSTASNSIDAQQWSSVRNPQSTSPASDLIAGLAVTQADGNTPWVGQYPFVVSITADSNGRETYQILGVPANPSHSVDTKAGFTQKGLPLDGTSSGVVQNPITYAGSNAVNAARGVTVNLPKITLRLTTAPLGLQPGENRQILIVFGASAVKNPCDGPTTKLDPQPFTLTYTAYDANSFGTDPSDQVSIDPSTDEPVVKTTTFNAACATFDELKTKITASQVGSAGDKLQRIQDILAPLIGKQRASLEVFARIQTANTAPAAPDDATRKAAKQELARTIAELAATATAAQDQLQPAIKALQDEIAKIVPPQTPPASVTQAVNAIVAYNTPTLGNAVTELTVLRDSILALSDTPSAEELRTKASAAQNSLNRLNTQDTITKMGSVVNAAIGRYQIFGNDAWLYDDKSALPTIIFTDPTTRMPKQWSYGAQEGTFKSVATTEGSVPLFTTTKFSVLVYVGDQTAGKFYDLFYETTTTGTSLVSAKVYDTAGNAVPGTPDPTLLQQIDAKKQDTTRQFMTNVIYKLSALIQVRPTAPTREQGVGGIYQIYGNDAFKYNKPADIINAVLTDANGLASNKVFYYDTTTGVYATGTVSEGRFISTAKYSVLNLNDGANQEIFFEDGKPVRMSLWRNDGASAGADVTDQTALLVRANSLRSRTDQVRTEILGPITRGQPTSAPTPAPAQSAVQEIAAIRAVLDKYSALIATEKPKYVTLSTTSDADFITKSTPAEQGKDASTLRSLQAQLIGLNDELNTAVTSSTRKTARDIVLATSVKNVGAKTASDTSSAIVNLANVGNAPAYRALFKGLLNQLSALEQSVTDAKNEQTNTVGNKLTPIIAINSRTRLTLTTKNGATEQQTIYDFTNGRFRKNTDSNVVLLYDPRGGTVVVELTYSGATPSAIRMTALDGSNPTTGGNLASYDSASQGITDAMVNEINAKVAP